MENQTMWDLEVSSAGGFVARTLVSSAYLGGFIGSMGKNEGGLSVVATPVRIPRYTSGDVLKGAALMRKRLGMSAVRCVDDLHEERTCYFPPCPIVVSSPSTGERFGVDPSERERRGL